MVDIATPTVGSRARDTPRTPHADDETFRVAEELMLLSASRAKGTTVGGGPETARRRQLPLADESNAQLRKRQKALTAQFELLMSPTSSDASLSPRRRSNPIAHDLKDILNSRVDDSPSQLLKEHRTHFRRARRRWNVERANRRKALLANFKVQGIPLVQHLATLTQWR